MPLKPKDLAILVYAGSFTMYHLKTEDDIKQKGYFDRGAPTLKQGDVIVVSLPGPSTKFLTVMANAKGTVTVAECGTEAAFLKPIPPKDVLPPEPTAHQPRPKGK